MSYTWYISLIFLLYAHFQDFVGSITVAPTPQHRTFFRIMIVRTQMTFKTSNYRIIRVAAAIAQGHLTSHNMRESDRDGDQDLTFWLRSLKNADGYSIRTEHRAIAAKLKYVILYIGIYHVSKWYMT